ncbi:MAG: hypothetical protein ACKOFW_07140, partial [Planctomycetaceae bacterium]
MAFLILTGHPATEQKNASRLPNKSGSTPGSVPNNSSREILTSSPASSEARRYLLHLGDEIGGGLP